MDYFFVFVFSLLPWESRITSQDYQLSKELYKYCSNFGAFYYFYEGHSKNGGLKVACPEKKNNTETQIHTHIFISMPVIFLKSMSLFPLKYR